MMHGQPHISLYELWHHIVLFVVMKIVVEYAASIVKVIVRMARMWTGYERKVAGIRPKNIN